MTRFRVKLSGGEIASTKIPITKTSTSSLSPCELLTELTTVSNQADPIEATNWLKQAVFTGNEEHLIINSKYLNIISSGSYFFALVFLHDLQKIRNASKEINHRLLQIDFFSRKERSQR